MSKISIETGIQMSPADIGGYSAPVGTTEREILGGRNIPTEFFPYRIENLPNGKFLFRASTHGERRIISSCTDPFDDTFLLLLSEMSGDRVVSQSEAVQLEAELRSEGFRSTESVRSFFTD